MAIRSEHVFVQVILVTFIYLTPFAFCKDSTPIPRDISKVEGWFKQNVQSKSQALSPNLLKAEGNVRMIRMKPDGSGDFKSLQQAINSIQPQNMNRVIIVLAPGKYWEKVNIPRSRRFVTFYGRDPKNKPILVYNGTGAKYGTFYSATLTVEGEYFSAVNVRFENSAPRPRGGEKGKQAVALRIGADKASFYSCEFIGFQDTLCDDQGRHFYKDCYIQGTVDFIFGAGKSLFLKCDIHIVPGDGVNYATAQGAESKLSDSGYSFVHCKVGGGNKPTGYLGRAWREHPKVVYSYSYLGDAVTPVAWSDNGNKKLDGTVYYAEYKNAGPRANMGGRFKYVKQLTSQAAIPFSSLQYIMGSKWLLPPRTF